MRIKVFNLLFFIFCLVFPAAEPEVKADHNREYQIKAAFLYNFIKFVDWPDDEISDSNEPIIIGLIGRTPFGDAFEPIKNKLVKKRKVVIKRLGGFEKPKKSDGRDNPKHNQQVKALRGCHLLFICSSERKNLAEIISLVKDRRVLTVGDTKGFLGAGGIINFCMEDNKVRFEINLGAARRTGLKIRSKLLRLARRIIEEKPSQDGKG